MAAKKRIRNILLIVLPAVLTCQILFDPLSGGLAAVENLKTRVLLPYARNKWEAHKIAHYKFDIRGYLPLVCLFGGSVEVKNGEVIRTGASGISNGFLDAGFSTSADAPLCDYRNYTMPGLFDLVASTLEYSGRASFDLEYGFVSEVKFGFDGGNGIFSPIISDCCGGFRIENFQVLE